MGTAERGYCGERVGGGKARLRSGKTGFGFWGGSSPYRRGKSLVDFGEVPPLPAYVPGGGTTSN